MAKESFDANTVALGRCVLINYERTAYSNHQTRNGAPVERYFGSIGPAVDVGSYIMGCID